MIGAEVYNFEYQDPIRLGHEITIEERNQKMKTGVITSRKGLIILGLCFIGVLGVAGVAIGASAKSTSNDNEVVAPVKGEPISPQIGLWKETLNVKPNDKNPQHQLLQDQLSAIKDKIENKKNNKNDKLKHKLKYSKKEHALVTVCETPECVDSAATLIENMDTTADPCVDFFQFACGGWYESHPVTDESEGTFYEASDLIQSRLRTILESPAGSSDPQPLIDIRNLYTSCVDTDTMEIIGLSILWSQIITSQGGWPLVMDTWDETSFIMESALSNVLVIGASPLYSLEIDLDFQNTSRKILYLETGELGLSSTYLLNPEDYATQIGYYKTYISDSAKLLRDSIGTAVTDAAIDQEVDDLVNFETAIANLMALLPSNTIAYGDITGFQGYTDSETAGQIDWLSFFRFVFEKTDIVINEDEVMYVFSPEYAPQLATLLSTTPARTIANYVGWSWMRYMGPDTTYAMRNVSFDFDQNIFGTTKPQARYDYCVDQVNNNLGFPLSRAYIDGYFPAEAKPETSQLVELMRDAFQSLFDENTWMAPEDLVVAKEKLAAIEDHVAYPDWIMNNAELTLAFQGLEINSATQFTNLINIYEYSDYWAYETYRDNVTKVYLAPPTVVNAFYDQFQNSITILAGILQKPFYVHNSLAALNYGGIGVVIGHEFTHGFDNNGRLFDKNGNLANWWSNETVDTFKNLSQCFVDQYSMYSPPELQGTEYSNMTVNGQQTLGENIADNGGIREAFRAYADYVANFGEEPRLPGLEDYTPNQLFFLGFATVWCEHRTNAALVRQLQSDPHSPGRFRVIGSVSNDADFSNTYNCPADSPMNKGNSSCVLW